MTASDSDSASEAHKGRDLFGDNLLDSGLAGPHQEKIQEHRRRFVAKLEATDADTARFTRLEERDKNPSEGSGWNEQGHMPSDVGRDAGVLAGNGLMNIDLDSYDEYPPPPLLEFLNDRPSLKGETPHGGERGFYTCPLETPALFEKALGVRNPGGAWGEIQTEGQHVVSPGSTLDHSNCLESKPCDGYGIDIYHLVNDREIRHLNHDDVERLIEVLDENRGASPPTQEETAFKTSQRPLRDYERAWLERAREMDDYLDRLCIWAENGGNPIQYDLRYSDRSSNEVGLAEKLLFQYGAQGDFMNPIETVIAVLDDLRPPKWRYAGKTYRKSVLTHAQAYAFDEEEIEAEETTWETADKQSDSADSLANARGVNRRQADVISLIIRYDMDGTFTTKEIEQRINASRPTINRVLRTWRDYGLLTLTGSGKNQYWKKNGEMPIDLPLYKTFLKDNFHSPDEIRQIRHQHLRED